MQKDEAAERRYITKSEACSQLGISYRTLQRMLEQRQLPHYRVAGLVRLAAADVDAYLAGARVEAEQA